MNIQKKLLSDESGYALAIALVMLVLGGLIIAPLLAFMGTNLNTGRMVDENTLEQYAADSGIEKVLWSMRYDTDFTLPLEGETYSFTQFQENDKTVDTSISKNTGESGYKIISTATSDNGDSTTIESYVEPLNLGGLLDSAITSHDDIEISPNCTVSGNVTYGGTIDNNGQIINGVVVNEDVVWPNGNDLAQYYWWNIRDLSPYSFDTINIASGTEADPVSMGPLYREGDLIIEGNGYGRLDGTVYVTGDFSIQPNPNINLNGQTIFVEGTITIQPGATLIGSGCLIALNENNETVACDINPNMEQDEDDFIAIMAYNGEVFLKPSGDFYGCIIGDALVDMQPNTTLYWREVGEGELNFPDEDDDLARRIVNYRTYIIK